VIALKSVLLQRSITLALGRKNLCQDHYDVGDEATPGLELRADLAGRVVTFWGPAGALALVPFDNVAGMVPLPVAAPGPGLKSDLTLAQAGGPATHADLLEQQRRGQEQLAARAKSGAGLDSAEAIEAKERAALEQLAELHGAEAVKQAAQDLAGGVATVVGITPGGGQVTSAPPPAPPEGVKLNPEPERKLSKAERRAQRKGGQ
jgi:hypothetical protein